MTFSRAVMCGKRLNRWKTMPILARWAAIAFSGSRRSRPPLVGVSWYPTSSPSMRMLPASKVSNWLMHRSSVDFPDPDGPSRTHT